MKSLTGRSFKGNNLTLRVSASKVFNSMHVIYISSVLLSYLISFSTFYKASNFLSIKIKLNPFYAKYLEKAIPALFDVPKTTA